jgi:Domain of unknown function (DUF4349)
MRMQRMAGGLALVAMLVACNKHPRTEAGEPHDAVVSKQVASPVRLGQMGNATVPERNTPAPAAGQTDEWAHADPFDASARLVVRSGQASIEVDSLEAAMAGVRRLVQRVGGFVADASVQSGRNQLRSATLELKVPASRFDDLTEGLGPIGRLQFVNVGAQDVSEEFVDLTARATNARRLEDRLVELLRTRTGKLQDVLTVERELARVREEIERMEGRLRFLKSRAELSTLSVNLFEPAPIIASHPGEGVLTEAFKTAWRNFVGLLAAAIASLGVVVPVVVFGWGAWIMVKRYRRQTV